MNAADLLAMLEQMLKDNVPLHKLQLRVEVGDAYYDADIKVTDQIYRTTYGDDQQFLVFFGRG